MELWEKEALWAWTEKPLKGIREMDVRRVFNSIRVRMGEEEEGEFWAEMHVGTKKAAHGLTHVATNAGPGTTVNCY